MRKTMQNDCPSEYVLDRWYTRELSHEEEQHVEAQTADCADCKEHLQQREAFFAALRQQDRFQAFVEMEFQRHQALKIEQNEAKQAATTATSWLQIWRQWWEQATEQRRSRECPSWILIIMALINIRFKSIVWPISLSLASQEPYLSAFYSHHPISLRGDRLRGHSCSSSCPSLSIFYCTSRSRHTAGARFGGMLPRPRSSLASR